MLLEAVLLPVTEGTVVVELTVVVTLAVELTVVVTLAVELTVLVTFVLDTVTVDVLFVVKVSVVVGETVALV